MSEMRFRIDARWYGPDGSRSFTEEVEATDACEALDLAIPGSYRIGQFDRCEISIAPIPHPHPEEIEHGRE